MAVFFIAPTAHAISNTGIIQGLWFSEENFFDGDTVRVYTALQNNSGEEVYGVVEFYRNDLLLGEKKFTARNNSITELWIDTVMYSGAHNYSACLLYTSPSPRDA